MTNQDQDSERKLISQLAPELSEELVTKLVGAFHDLRKGYEDGKLSYPYSLRGWFPFLPCDVIGRLIIRSSIQS